MLIDVHQHALPPFLVEAFGAAGRLPALARFPDWTPQLAFDLMDACSIDRALLSMAVPGAHLGQDGPAESLARRFNDYLADLATVHPLIGGFAALPLPFVDGALREVARALDELRLDGVGLFASYGDRFLGDPMFDPVMAELDGRDAIVFVHPMGHPSSRALTLKIPLWMLEYPIDTTRAAVNLMLSGTLDRFPRIRFILAHGGGTLPFLASRLAGTTLIDGRHPDFTEERVDGYLRHFFYETAQASGAASFAALSQVAGADHILFGTDFPYCGQRAIEAMMSKLTLLPEGRRTLTASGERLFGKVATSADRRT